MSVGNNSRKTENEVKVFGKDWLRVKESHVFASHFDLLYLFK